MFLPTYWSCVGVIGVGNNCRICTWIVGARGGEVGIQVAKTIIVDGVCWNFMWTIGQLAENQAHKGS